MTITLILDNNDGGIISVGIQMILFIETTIHNMIHGDNPPHRV